jgi:hypothetical protein
MKDIEIVSNEACVPEVMLRGEAKAEAKAAKGISTIHLSLSHSDVSFSSLLLTDWRTRSGCQFLDCRHRVRSSFHYMNDSLTFGLLTIHYIPCKHVLIVFSFCRKTVAQ